MNSKRSKKAYANLTPSLVIPNHFNCNQETTMVALYDEPVGSERDTIAMLFPGDITGTPPRKVTTRRIGTQSIVFCTPIYSTSRGQVEVSPVLTQRNGEKIRLGKFRLTLKHPLTTVMELCMKLSSSSAVLPVLTTLMLSVDKNGDKAHFMDSHTDRMMTLLVGSMKPGTSGTIKDILMPDKKWSKKNLTDLARMFGLRNMEKEAYMVTSQRRQGALKRTETVSTRHEEFVQHESSPLSDEVSNGTERAEGGGMVGSFSSPSINTAGLEEQEGGVTETIQMTKRHMSSLNESVYTVLQDFHSRDPGTLTLKAGQKVYVVTQNTSEPGWWYGAFDGRHGVFPGWCMEPPYKKSEARNLPLPTPPKEPLPSVFVGKSSSPPATFCPRGGSVSLPQQERSARTRTKVFKKSESVDSVRAQHYLGQSAFSESGEYVDMHLASNLSSDSESGEPEMSPERKAAVVSEWQPIAVNARVQTRPPLPLPTLSPTEPAGEVQQRQKSSPIAPPPPIRTVSMHLLLDESASNDDQLKGASDSDDDHLDYVNVDSMGNPQINLDKEKKASYVNIKLQGFELVKGHVYDRPNIPEHVHKEPPEEKTDPHEEGRARANSEERMLESSFQVDLQEFENRKQARLWRQTGRLTHENVKLPRRDIVRPVPLPRHDNTSGGTRERVTALPRPKQLQDSRGGNRKQVKRDNT